MAQVELNAPAPDFTLADYQGNHVSLSQFKGKQHVLLVFNRGFM
ncbi:MAG: redoxin domain-containing protein [Ardenticatenaceae bacterium]|nr:redoxin domain-containing protein [Anaerolineales bacterium]MCB8940882.1 redoxin domain-containing protein [Ardenticatenaceae bacterium]MCB8972221.1 redoxin domain-containing protein [Ardenticatenaceae bacterium]